MNKFGSKKSKFEINKACVEEDKTMIEKRDLANDQHKINEQNVEIAKHEVIIRLLMENEIA